VILTAGHGDSDDDIEDGRWGALLDALEAGGARAGAGFRADEGGLGGRSSAEVAADGVRVAAARGGVRLASRVGLGRHCSPRHADLWTAQYFYGQ